MNRTMPSSEPSRWFVAGHAVAAEDLDPWSPVSGDTRAALRAPDPPAAPRAEPDLPPPPAAVVPSGLPAAAFAELCARVAGEELAALAIAYRTLRGEPSFFADYARNVSRLLARPTPLQLASALGASFGHPGRVFLKREDLRSVTVENENATAQAYIAWRLGARTLVTAADAQAHALAVVAAARHFGLTSVVVARPDEVEGRPLFAAALHTAALEDATRYEAATADPREAAVRFWKEAPAERHLALAPGVGPAPYPLLAADWSALLGCETGLQLRARADGAHPRTFVASINSEADAVGFMLPQLAYADAERVYAEPDGDARLRSRGRLAPYDGLRSRFGELRASEKVTFLPVTDAEARDAARQVLEKEGVVVSVEDARAIAAARRLAERGFARDLVVLAA